MWYNIGSEHGEKLENGFMILNLEIEKEPYVIASQANQIFILRILEIQHGVWLNQFFQEIRIICPKQSLIIMTMTK